MARKKKVSYNPFKMLGSWIGAILLFLNTLIFNGYLFIIPGDMFTGSTYYFLLIIIQSTLGFLIGWGINSLWRYFNK